MVAKNNKKTKHKEWKFSHQSLTSSSHHRSTLLDLDWASGGPHHCTNAWWSWWQWLGGAYILTHLIEWRVFNSPVSPRLVKVSPKRHSTNKLQFSHFRNISVHNKPAVTPSPSLSLVHQTSQWKHTHFKHQRVCPIYAGARAPFTASLLFGEGASGFIHPLSLLLTLTHLCMPSKSGLSSTSSVRELDELWSAIYLQHVALNIVLHFLCW